MKISTFLLICIFSVGVLAQDSNPGPERTSISDLGWMAGCWIQYGKSKDDFISEQWTKPFGVMLGTNRTVRDGKVRTYEYMRIESREKDIYFVAKPASAAGETSFKMISMEAERVVFENKEHDFPKRLIYRKGDGAELKATAEDDSNGIEFVFRKIDCDG